MVLRLKVLRQQEQRMNKVKELMDIWKVHSFPSYQYQPIGASSLVANDPRIQKTRDLFQMFHLV